MSPLTGNLTDEGFKEYLRLLNKSTSREGLSRRERRLWRKLHRARCGGAEAQRREERERASRPPTEGQRLIWGIIEGVAEKIREEQVVARRLARERRRGT